MGTKFCYCPLKILWTCKESAKTLVIRIWFYAWLYFYCFKSLLIVISEEKSWWNPCWNTDGYLCNCASSLMCYNRFSGCPNFCLRLSHFPFIFNIPPNLQLQCTILDGYQIQNDLTLSMVDASSSSSEIPWITMLCNGVIFCVIYVIYQMSLYFQGSGCLLDISFSLIYRIYLHYVSFLCVRVPKHVSSETFPFLQSTFRFMLIVNWCLLMKVAMWEGLIYLQLEPLQVILQNVS